jgi:hypothetical protein
LVVGFDDLCIDENDTEFSSVENDGEEDLNVQDLPLDNIEELELRQQHLKHQTIDEEPVVGDEQVVDEEQVVGEEKVDDEEQVVGEEKVVG